jgi:hypothetical protein
MVLQTETTISLAIILAFITLLLYILALFPITSGIQKYRKSIGSLALVVGIIHGVMMVEAYQLSYFSLETYARCAPILLTLTMLTILIHQFEKFQTNIQNLFKKNSDTSIEADISLI